MELGDAPHIVTSDEALIGSQCSDSSSIGSAGLEVLISREGYFPKGHSIGQFKLQVETDSWLLGVTLATEPTGQKRVH
jgi:hypothetical protein